MCGCLITSRHLPLSLFPGKQIRVATLRAPKYIAQALARESKKAAYCRGVGRGYRSSFSAGFISLSSYRFSHGSSWYTSVVIANVYIQW